MIILEGTIEQIEQGPKPKANQKLELPAPSFSLSGFGASTRSSGSIQAKRLCSGPLALNERVSPTLWGRPHHGAVLAEEQTSNSSGC